MYDATIVGGGPAGLSAALMLGRARRRVLLCDTGQPRNAASHAMHGFLSRDGSDPAELRRVGRAQLRPYDCIDVRDTAVVQASGAAGRFTLTLDGGERLDARRLVLAFGVKDQLPDIEGLRTLWGRGVFPCPYCDGWEVRDQPLAALGNGPQGLQFALLLSKWSRDLVLCTNGPAELDGQSRALLASRGIDVKEAPLQQIEGEDASLSRIIFRDGSALARRALFFRAPCRPSSELAQQLGCDMSDEGAIVVNAMCQTSVPGVYAAGDAAQPAGLPFPPASVIVAAAQGAIAGRAIDRELLMEDLAPA
jgi:thioredoxin reductase